MDIFDTIRKRRSVFPDQYTDRPIPRETLQKLLDAANWAPNHMKTEPWRFKVITGEKRKELGAFLSRTYEQTAERPKKIKARKLLENPQKSAAVIVINMQRDLDERLPAWEELAAVAMAVQNIWLGCTELGIGCYWSSPGVISEMHNFLEMQPGEKCLGLLYMGYYEEELPAGVRGDLADKVEWIG